MPVNDDGMPFSFVNNNSTPDNAVNNRGTPDNIGTAFNAINNIKYLVIVIRMLGMIAEFI